MSNMLTREDDGEEDQLSVDPKRRENYGLIYEREREGKPNADCQSRSPIPSTSAEPFFSPLGQTRPMGAGEAGGGRRGRWGQARPMGAVSHRPHARAHQHRTLEKPPGQIPSQHSPSGPRLSRRNKVNETNKQKPKALLRVPNPIKSKHTV